MRRLPHSFALQAVEILQSENLHIFLEKLSPSLMGLVGAVYWTLMGREEVNRPFIFLESVRVMSTRTRI